MVPIKKFARVIESSEGQQVCIYACGCEVRFVAMFDTGHAEGNLSVTSKAVAFEVVERANVETVDLLLSKISEHSKV